VIYMPNYGEFEELPCSLLHYLLQAMALYLCGESMEEGACELLVDWLRGEAWWMGR
jgi:hypothetical protein